MGHLAEALTLLSVIFLPADDDAHRQFSPINCNLQASVERETSQFEPLTLATTATTQTYEFKGLFFPIVQGFVDRCDKNRPKEARVYHYFQFSMTSEVVSSGPNRTLPVVAAMDFALDAYVDPIRSQVGGPTIERIDFFDSSKGYLLSFAVSTAPEPKCNPRTSTHLSFKGRLNGMTARAWSAIRFMRVVASRFDTTGKC